MVSLKTVLFLFAAFATLIATDDENLYVKTAQWLLTECTRNMNTSVSLTVVYFSINPHSFVIIPPFLLSINNLMFSDMSNHATVSENFMKLMCTCAGLEPHSFDFFVMPLISNNQATDALTLCVYHDNVTNFWDVLNVPEVFIETYMMSQYMLLMPRKLEAPTLEKKADVCIDKNGIPTNSVPGQHTCYYLNYIKVNDAAEVIMQELYYGPFLASQLPNLLNLFDSPDEAVIKNFMPKLYFIQCAMLKSKTKLNATAATGCEILHLNEKNITTLVLSCCCIGRNDSKCSKVTKAIEAKDKLCLNQEKNLKDWYFAPSCSYKIKTAYHSKNNQHQKLLRMTHRVVNTTNTINCKQHLDFNCLSSNRSVIIVDDIRCCSNGHFCNFVKVLSVVGAPCKYSFDENFDHGCQIVLTLTNGHWEKMSPFWFDIQETHILYEHANITTYSMQIAYLTVHDVPNECKPPFFQKTRPYFLYQCSDSMCDLNTYKNFFSSFTEDYLNFLITKTETTLCPHGEIHFNALQDEPLVVPNPSNVVDVFGPYCYVNLTIIMYEDHTLHFDIFFSSVFSRPVECIYSTGVVITSNTVSYVCCTKGNVKPVINPNCHYSTIIETVEKKMNNILMDSENNHTNVYENSDDCDQRYLGFFDKQNCHPGGIGCFHLIKGNSAEEEKTYASCIGYAEHLIVDHNDYAKDVNDALICRTPEAENKCQVVMNGVSTGFLCCCRSQKLKNHVFSCGVDSKTLLHQTSHTLQKVSDFN